MGTYNTYTPEQEEWLKSNAQCMSRKELAEQFNTVFCQNRSIGAIKSHCNKISAHSASDGKFKTGNESWQKGIKSEAFKEHYTAESFKQLIGNMIEANKTRKLGDEIVIDGVPWIIVSLDYNIPFCERRQPKRRVVWEQLHGPIPDGCCIINLDGDKMNCEPDNLFCMPIKYRSIIAKNKWWFKSAEMMRTVMKWCELLYAIKEGYKRNE